MTVVFFKQKTAYEVRISDWSSDVCSSDLLVGLGDLFLDHPAGGLRRAVLPDLRPHDVTDALGAVVDELFRGVGQAGIHHVAVGVDRSAVGAGDIQVEVIAGPRGVEVQADRKSTRLNSSQ